MIAAAAKAGSFIAKNKGNIADFTNRVNDFTKKGGGETGPPLPSAAGMPNPMAGMAAKLLEIDPFTLIVSIVVSFVMYMTHQWTYWVKACLSVVILVASFYFTMPFKPANLPFYVLFIYIFIDYLELNKQKSKGGGEKKKKKSTSSSTESTWWFM